MDSPGSGNVASSAEICSLHATTVEFSGMNDEDETALKLQQSMDMPLLSEDGEPLGRYMITLTAVSAIGGFLFGYDSGVVSGAILKIKEDMGLVPWQEETVVSVTIAGAIIGSITGGPLNDLVGRKPMMATAAAIFTVGAVVLGFAGSFGMLSVGRVTVGIGIGVASVTTPVYIAEAAPSSLRGQLVALNTLLIPFGQFIAGVVDGVLANVPQGWRWMLGLSGVPSLVMLIGVLPLPESPRWLLGRGRVEEATAVLQKLRGKLDVYDEVESISATISSNHHQKPASLREMLFVPPLRRALIVGCGVQILQQFLGINIVMYYAAEIYSIAGYSDATAIWLSALAPLSQTIGCLVCMYSIESHGRRKLLLYSCVGASFCLLVVGLSFLLSAMASERAVVGSDPWDADCEHIDSFFFGRKEISSCLQCVNTKGCGFCLVDGLKFGNCYAAAAGSNGSQQSTDVLDRCDSNNWIPQSCPERFSALGVVGILSYLFAFGLGASTVPWTLNAEIYPQYARSLGNSLATACNWISNFVVSATFLSISSPTTGITIYGAFWMYALIGFFGGFWVYVAVPETKGRSMGEIQTLFEREDGMSTLSFRKVMSVCSSAGFEPLPSGAVPSMEVEFKDIHEGDDEYDRM
eukprot:287401_1